MVEAIIESVEKILPQLNSRRSENASQGLAHISEKDLRQIVEPVRKSLEELDTEELLNLSRCRHGCDGASLGNGMHVKPIHEEIKPHRQGIRYLHIVEVQHHYNIGVFVFPPHTRIPLHDHPGMVVLSRILYGELLVKSFDVLSNELVHKSAIASIGKIIHQSSWVTNFLSKICHQPSNNDNISAGSLRAVEHDITPLIAPEVSVLYPYGGNLHEFTAGDNGAAVLDVLMPPYNNHGNRDCTFYQREMIEDNNQNNNFSSCLLVPIEQPPDFTCISGTYGQWGRSDEWSTEEDSFEED